MFKNIDTPQLCKSVKESNDTDSMQRYIMLLHETFSRNLTLKVLGSSMPREHVSKQRSFINMSFQNGKIEKASGERFGSRVKEM